MKNTENRNIMFEVFKGGISELKDLIAEYKLLIGEEKLNESEVGKLGDVVRNGDIIFFVARKDEKIIGMCSISHTFSTYNCEYGGVFEDFYVKPDFRGQGIAKGLVGFVFEYCKKQNIATLWVGCCDGDAEMYKHIGFKYPLGRLFTWNKNQS